MSDVLQLRDDGVAWREIDGEVVALEAAGATYLAANPAGTLLWRELATGATRDELVCVLRDAYGLDDAVATTDVDGFIADVRGRGLLRS